jgi:hypothetical protein
MYRHVPDASVNRRDIFIADHLSVVLQLAIAMYASEWPVHKTACKYNWWTVTLPMEPFCLSSWQLASTILRAGHAFIHTVPGWQCAGHCPDFIKSRSSLAGARGGTIRDKYVLV